MRAVRPANRATECVVLTSCSATKCSPMSVAPCAIICFCFLPPLLDVPATPRRHEPDEPRALPLRDPSRNGLRILALPFRDGRRESVPRRRLRRALRLLAPRHRAARVNVWKRKKSGATAPVHHSCSDDDDEPARRAGAVSRRFWWREMNDVAGLVSSTRATRRDTERITHVITTLTVLADASPESRSRASSPTQPRIRGPSSWPPRESVRRRVVAVRHHRPSRLNPAGERLPSHPRVPSLRVRDAQTVHMIHVASLQDVFAVRRVREVSPLRRREFLFLANLVRSRRRRFEATRGRTCRSCRTPRRVRVGCRGWTRTRSSRPSPPEPRARRRRDVLALFYQAGRGASKVGSRRRRRRASTLLHQKGLTLAVLDERADAHLVRRVGREHVGLVVGEPTGEHHARGLGVMKSKPARARGGPTRSARSRGESSATPRGRRARSTPRWMPGARR